MVQFHNDGRIYDAEVIALAGPAGDQPGDPDWYVVSYPIFSFFDPSEQQSQFWAYAVKNADGSYRRNGTMHYSTKKSREDVISFCQSKGFKMLVEAA